MPLLGEIQGFLDILNSVEPPPPPASEEELLLTLRSTFAMLQEPVNGDLAVASVKDTVLDHGGLRIPVRVYVPTGKPVALMVYFHGGGFTIGSVDTHDGLTRRYCGNGSMVVISVDYRLAPENAFPAAIEDALHSTLWAQEHAADFGLTAEQVVIAGDSAGANLAAVVAIEHSRMVRDGRVTAPLAGHIMHCPVTDGRSESDQTYASRSDNAVGYMLTGDLMRAFMHFYGSSGAVLDDERVSPIISKDLRGLAPALLITAEYDPLRDEGEAYGDLLRAAGNKVVSRRFDGTIHVFMMFSSMECAKQADELVYEFIRANVPVG